MIYLKTDEEISVIRQGGRILSDILAELVAMSKPGADTAAIDARAEELMRQAGGEPAFKGYRGSGGAKPFPSTICASINDEVVHGLAVPARELQDGDLFKIDIGLRYQELYTDMAVTVPIGRVSKEAERLRRSTKEALLLGLGKVKSGGWISDIGKAVDKYVRRQGYSTVKDLVGHGVGKYVHEEPQIPNYFDAAAEPIRIEPGMVLAIEPMVNAGGDAVRVLSDGWTVVTVDKSLSAHFEATVAVDSDGRVDIMTPFVEGV